MASHRFYHVAMISLNSATGIHASHHVLEANRLHNSNEVQPTGDEESRYGPDGPCDHLYAGYWILYEYQGKSTTVCGRGVRTNVTLNVKFDNGVVGPNNSVHSVKEIVE